MLANYNYNKRKGKSKKKRKQSTSKRYVNFSIALACLITLYTMIIAPLVGDYSVFVYLITASYGNLATALGFYFNKAKRENTKGGITYEAAMLEIENENSDNAVG